MYAPSFHRISRGTAELLINRGLPASAKRDVNDENDDRGLVSQHGSRSAIFTEVQLICPALRRHPLQIDFLHHADHFALEHVEVAIVINPDVDEAFVEAVELVSGWLHARLQGLCRHEEIRSREWLGTARTDDIADWTLYLSAHTTGILGMDIRGMEIERDEQAPLRDIGRQMLAARVKKLDRVGMLAVVEGMLIEAFNQLESFHEFDETAAKAMLDRVLFDAQLEHQVDEPFDEFEEFIDEWREF